MERNVHGTKSTLMVRNVYGTNSLWYEKSGNPSHKGAEKNGFQGAPLNVIQFQKYLAQTLFMFSGTICRYERLKF